MQKSNSKDINETGKKPDSEPAEVSDLEALTADLEKITDKRRLKAIVLKLMEIAAEEGKDVEAIYQKAMGKAREKK